MACVKKDKKKSSTLYPASFRVVSFQRLWHVHQSLGFMYVHRCALLQNVFGRHPRDNGVL